MGRIVAEEVEADLADRNDLACRDRARVLAVRCLVRMDTRGDEHLALALRDRADGTRRLQAGGDRDDAIDADRPCAGDRAVRIIERVEVRVGIDQIGSSFLNNGSGSRSFCPAGRSVGPQPCRQSR